MLKGGQEVSTSIATLGADFNAPIIEWRQADYRLLNFFQCDGEVELAMKQPYSRLVRMTDL